MKAAYFALTLLLASAATLPARAQEQGPSAPADACTTVTGYVTDGAQPLAGVTVMVQGTKLLAITNSDGFFSLPLESATPAKLLFDAIGYESQALTATTCQSVRLELSLLPGTRVRQRGKHKGFIMKAGELPTAAN